MKVEQLDSQKNITMTIKSLPRLFKILLIVFAGLILLALSFRIGDFIYCHTVAICDHPSPMATQIPIQYEYAIQDINAGRYQNAKQRLEYILVHDPEYPGAKEKLSEVEKILKLTPTP